MNLNELVEFLQSNDPDRDGREAAMMGITLGSGYPVLIVRWYDPGPGFSILGACPFEDRTRVSCLEIIPSLFDSRESAYDMAVRVTRSLELRFPKDPTHKFIATN